jgi:NAD+ kinase
MHFDTVALFGRYQDTGLEAPLRAIAQVLQQAGCKIIVETATAINTCLTEFKNASADEIGRQAKLAIVVGGDGTVLSTARDLAPFNMPMLGINHGRLGFITDIALEHAKQAVADILAGNYSSESRMLLEGSVWRGEEQLYSARALNDVVLNRAGRGGMIELQVELDDIFMYSLRADGLIIATPTGSTAYALSAGGPLVHPAVNAMVLVPVAPQTLSNRPIVLPDSGMLQLTLKASGRVEVGSSVHFDMQSWSDLMPGDRVRVCNSKHTVRLLHPKGYSFFSTLRHKLNWNQLPIAWPGSIRD